MVRMKAAPEVPAVGPLGAVSDPPPGVPRFLGGRLCLDFANTIGSRYAPNAREHLTDYQDLVAWGRHAGALPADHAPALLRLAADDPAGAVRAHRRARGVR